MRKEIKTKKQLIERLNEIDRKCIDEGTHFYDFKTLFEANSNRLSAQDKLALKKAVDIGDKEAIEAVFQAKMAEDFDFEDDEFDDYEPKLSDKEIIRRIFGDFGVKLFNITNEFDDLISVNVDADGYREVEETLDREIFNSGFDIVSSNVGEPNRFTEKETIDITLIKDEDSDDLKEEINLKDYNDGYVELRDGKPQFVYSSLKDAKDGMFWSQRGDSEYDLGKHSYEIKKWENGELKDLNESYEDDQYDYFVVYKGKIMQGEYPTYEEAKKNADKDCIIKGVIQYGGSEFEETEIKESFEEEDLGFNDYLLKNYGIASDDLSDDDYDRAWNEFENYLYRDKYLKEDANQTKEFEYELTIYIDASSQDDYFDYNGEYDFIDKEDIQYSLNSYMEKIYLGFPDFDFDIYEEDTTKDTIIETLYVDIPQEENITYEKLKDELRRVINDWSYNTTVEVEQQIDVDDFITHYVDVVATADIDIK